MQAEESKVNKPVAVLDTNIYVSAAFWSGEPYLVVQKAITQEIIDFISQEIVGELREVLARDFNLGKEDIEEIVKAVFFFTHLTKPKEKVSIIKDDPDDDRILECALSCKADFVVTQDNHLLKLKEFRGIKILTPKEFLRILKE